ncbi:hypothetical protein, conserved, partial [Eimeria maxima]
ADRELGESVVVEAETSGMTMARFQQSTMARSVALTQRASQCVDECANSIWYWGRLANVQEQAESGNIVGYWACVDDRAGADHELE